MVDAVVGESPVSFILQIFLVLQTKVYQEIPGISIFLRYVFNEEHPGSIEQS